MKWHEKINRAEEECEFTQEDRLDAGSWQCCSMAERLGEISKKYYQNRISSHATFLCNSFCESVELDDFPAARRIHEYIQKLTWPEIILDGQAEFFEKEVQA